MSIHSNRLKTRVQVGRAVDGVTVYTTAFIGSVRGAAEFVMDHAQEPLRVDVLMCGQGWVETHGLLERMRRGEVL